MKIRDRENRKFLTGFRDMADFFTGNWDPIPPLVGPFITIALSLRLIQQIRRYQDVISFEVLVRHREAGSQISIRSIPPLPLPPQSLHLPQECAALLGSPSFIRVICE